MLYPLSYGRVTPMYENAAPLMHPQIRRAVETARFLPDFAGAESRPLA